MPKLARCLHNLYLFMCGSRGGGGLGTNQAFNVGPAKRHLNGVSLAGH